MTKKDFCECMEIIKKRDNACNQVLDKMYDLFGDTDKMYDVLNVLPEIEILAIAMDDKNEWIDYYVYECNWNGKDRVKDSDGNEIPLETYEDLYEMIKGDNEKRNKEINNAFMEALKQNFEDIKKEEKINFDAIKMRGDV